MHVSSAMAAGAQGVLHREITTGTRHGGLVRGRKLCGCMAMGRPSSATTAMATATASLLRDKEADGRLLRRRQVPARRRSVRRIVAAPSTASN